jgi:nucleolar protein 12
MSLFPGEEGEAPLGKLFETQKLVQTVAPEQKAAEVSAAKLKSASRKVKKLEIIKQQLAEKNLKSGSLTPEQLADKQKRTLFIANVPVNAKKTKLKSLATQYGGPVESLRFRGTGLNPKVYTPKAKRDISSKPSTQLCFVVFKESESVEKCIKSDFNGFELNGHRLRLDTDGSSSKEFDRKRSIYLHNLPGSVSDADIIKAIEAIHEIKVKGVRLVVMKKDTKKKFAYVLLETRKMVADILKVPSLLINGQTVKHEKVLEKTEATKEKMKREKSKEMALVKKQERKQKNIKKMEKRFGNKNK